MVNQIIGSGGQLLSKQCEKWVNFSTLIRLTSKLSLHIITKLLMQFLRLSESYGMIGYSLLSKDVNFVKIGWL